MDIIRNGKYNKDGPEGGCFSSSLRGKQSVRATFRLSKRAIDILSLVSSHLKIKQKSLFDHLFDDPVTMDYLAQGIEIGDFIELDRVQKTYVISRKTLSCLDNASRSFDSPRDALVEYAVYRLLPVIKEEREKQWKRKQVLSDINLYLKKGMDILHKSREALGEDDPLCLSLEKLILGLDNACSEMVDFVEKGSIIETFDKEGDK